jgi:hypothetical protein
VAAVEAVGTVVAVAVAAAEVMGEVAKAEAASMREAAIRAARS